MVKTVVKIDGMMCGMCEAHINGAIRSAFDVKKVTSSHTKNETVIISENGIDEGKLRDVIDKTGYKVITLDEQPYEKKGLLSFLK
jgi:copper chaperone CopZ